ncbi:TetR/AcrR family transcriptional regulator [Bailinhaonella thermotolerans]|uniref:TetR/AcrR family transcriptional regulator n=2 Tax=Bailinhaonella thermotolerans TaxID=1070861 RepID=A0A3A4BAB0_9ACTN|nr:TetR/AcrR family transcriptional regulator [Bailinhaonella thermotolerans]
MARAEGEGGFARRRAATRAALLRAAQRLLAGGRGEEVSIQRITEEAGVGFGSFHNHFDSKAELFEAAVRLALDEFAEILEGATRDATDPAEKFAAKARLTFHLIDRRPQLVRILARHGHLAVQAETGLGPRALQDIAEGMTAGRFRVADPRTALYAVSGALLGLIQLRLETPSPDPAFAETGAELLLRLLGVPDPDAHTVSRRPLPPLPAGGARP